MADNVITAERMGVTPDNDEALVNVEQAFDAMVASVQVINENLPNVKTESVPEQAAKDAVKDVMDNAIAPYLSDALKAMSVFGG